ncbi:MAG: class I SAM-dependent methyltransferase, partial [Desulfovibrionaceae bacterium]|nr:class I SAM-dependent methyltransferase [Desulfovibrionaceae bacterium]
MREPSPEDLRPLLLNQGFNVGEEALTTLSLYLEKLMQWNKVMNLVGAHSWKQALDELILDSLRLDQFLRSHFSVPHPVCFDLGSGAGLPGIPLRTVWQDGSYTMVESREKRALFITTVLAICRLPRTFCLMNRAENVLPNEGADLIVSRAFMPWPRLLDFVRPFVRQNGYVALLLNDPAEEKWGWKRVAAERYQSGKHE